MTFQSRGDIPMLRKIIPWYGTILDKPISRSDPPAVYKRLSPDVHQEHLELHKERPDLEIHSRAGTEILITLGIKQML